jgi:hypothetical protein
MLSFPRLLASLRRRKSVGENPATEAEAVVVCSGQRLELVQPPRSRVAQVEKNNYLATFAQALESQAGEEGVIDEILRRLGIECGWCVEFGAYDGKAHSNTWHLVAKRNWKGVFIEPFEPAFDELRKNYATFCDVFCFRDLVGWEGDAKLDCILARTPIPTDFDLLVVDIDGNDFYVWRACEVYRPKIVMIEFNPFVAPDIKFVKPADQDTTAAASLLAMYELAKLKGYELICVVGGNAFFVRKEYFDLFDVADNRPPSMFLPIAETKIFQGYEGSLFLAGQRQLNWRFQITESGQVANIELSDVDVQVLPSALRVFRPRLSYHNPFLEEWANRLERARVPDNQLLEYRANITSECGEDGILRELFRRLAISEGYCVDVGAADGRTFSATWSLLNAGGWRGALIEKDLDACAAAEMAYAGNSDVKIVRAKVTSTGCSAITAVLERVKTPRTFDFLCIDIEGNDFNIWRSLVGFEPRVVMVDINPTVPNDVLFVQEDNPEVHYGASLRAFVELGKAKGYELAAATSWNAIFVHHDLFATLGLTGNDLDQMYYPPFEMKIFQSMDGFLSVQGCTRLFRHNYVFDPEKLQPLPPNLRRPLNASKFGQRPSYFFNPKQ